MIELLPDADSFARAIDAVAREEAASLPLLGDETNAALLRSCNLLRYRDARPLVGAEGREVRQDFELSMDIPEDHLLRDLARSLGDLTSAALRSLSPNPLPQGVVFNDLIVQRYQSGSAGITPHRDHVRYVGLVALVTLAGRSELLLCDDRGGSNPRAFPMAPGMVNLMRAPGFAGSRVRPFHLVGPLAEPRVSVGLRHDTRPGEPP